MKAWGLAAALGAWHLAALLSAGTALGASTYTWGNLAGGGGSWDTPANWAGGSVPATVAGDSVYFQADFTTAAPIITLDGARTLGKLYLGDSGSPYYDVTVAAGTGGSLVFNNGGSVSYIYASAQGAGGDTISAPITLNSALYISNSSTGTAVLTLSGPISGNGYGIATVGSNSVTVLSGTQANTFTGTTNINIGTLQLNKTAGIDAIAGDIVISNGTLKLQASNQIKDTAKVTLNSGTLNLNGQSDDFASFTFNGGTLSSTADLSSSLSWLSTNTITYSGVSAPARISAGINMGGSAWTYSVNNGSATADLTLSGVLSGEGGGLVKTGAGRMDLTNTNNSYTGSTVVKSGTVVVSGLVQPGINSALGNSTSAIVLGDTSGGNAAATLLFATAGTHTRDITVQSGNTGTMTIGGSAANTVVYTGALTLNNDVTLTAISGGTFDVATAIAGAGRNVTINGGTIIFSGTQANTYTGATYVNAGTLQFNKAGGVAASGSTSFIIGDGAGATGSAVLQRPVTAGQFPTNSTIVVNADGKLDFNGLGQTLASLTVNGGNVSNMAYLSVSGTLSVTGTAISTDTGLSAGILNLTNATVTTGPQSSVSAGLINLTGATIDTGTGMVSLTDTVTATSLPGTGSSIKSGSLDLGGTNRTFVISRGSEAIDLTVSAVITNGSVNLSEAGVTVFSGTQANTYTGRTYVWWSAGTLRLAKSPGAYAVPGDLTICGTVILDADNQISPTSNVRLVGGTFDVNGKAVSFNSFAFIEGTLASTGGPLTDNMSWLSSRTIAYTGTSPIPGTVTADINMGTNAWTYYANSSYDTSRLSLSGVLGGTGASLIKTGTGRMDITGTNNTYTGDTTILAGTLVAYGIVAPGVNSSLGNSTSAIVLGDTNGSASAALLFATAGTHTRDITVQAGNNGSMTIGGLAANTVVYTGNLTLNKDVTFTATGGGKFDIATALAGGGIVTINCAGTVIFSGSQANTYTGTTYINAGTLQLNKTVGVNAIAGDIVIGGGVLQLMATGQIKDTAKVTLVGGTLASTTDLNSGMNWLAARTITYTGTNIAAVISAGINMGSSDWTYYVNDGTAVSDLTLSGTLSGTSASLIKTGGGRLVITNIANTYTGDTVIRAGTVVVSGTVRSDTNGPLGKAASAIVLGDTMGAASATLLFATNTTHTRAITVQGGNTGIMTLGTTSSATYTGVLTLNKDVTFTSGNGSGFDVKTAVGGDGINITIHNAGIVSFSGTQANTYTGSTHIDDGFAIFEKTGGVWASGGTTFFIGDGNGAANSAFLEFAQSSNQMSPDSAVVVKSDGSFLLLGFSQTVASLDLTGAMVATGTGTLTIRGSIAATSVTGKDSIIKGNLNLGGGSRTFAVARGPYTSDLSVSAIISNGGVVKSGVGIAVFTGTQANTYTGATYVNDGTLQLNKTAGVNAIAGDVVIGGGTLILSASNQIADTASVTVNGGTFDIGGMSEYVNSLAVNGGTLAGCGTIGVGGGAGTLTINSGNLLAPDSIGKLGVGGSLAFANGGKLNLNFLPKVGMVAGVDYSQVNVTGTASLANSVLNVYLPVPSATFNPDTLAANGPLTVLISNNDLSAQTFGTVNVSAYGDRGYTVTPIYGNGFVKLSIAWTALPGDADLNGTIDGGDYDLLVGYFGAASGADWTMADFDYNGKVDGGDYDLLVGYFGTTYPGVGTANIPEPTSLVLLALGVIGLRHRGHRAGRDARRRDFGVR